MGGGFFVNEWWRVEKVKRRNRDAEVDVKAA